MYLCVYAYSVSKATVSVGQIQSSVDGWFLSVQLLQSVREQQ
jgi:hypothetical protein